MGYELYTRHQEETTKKCNKLRNGSWLTACPEAVSASGTMAMVNTHVLRTPILPYFFVFKGLPAHSCGTSDAATVGIRHWMVLHSNPATSWRIWGHLLLKGIHRSRTRRRWMRDCVSGCVPSKERDVISCTLVYL